MKWIGIIFGSALMVKGWITADLFNVIFGFITVIVNAAWGDL